MDKKAKEIYEIIAPIIESYCSQITEIVEIESGVYDFIFKTLDTIRTNKNNIIELKNIIKRRM
jgi:hypothetical protein